MIDKYRGSKIKFWWVKQCPMIKDVFNFLSSKLDPEMLACTSCYLFTMAKSIELPLLLMFCNDYYFVSSCDEFEFLNVKI